MNRFGDVDFSFKRLPAVFGYHSQKLVSLEKALEAIVSEIDELPHYIKIAKRHCLYPSEHDLTRDESAAIYIYTMEWDESSLYRVLNKALRDENRQALKIWFPYLNLFDSALDKLPTVKEVVWRGVPLDIGNKFTKDQIVTWWSINSCSSSVNIIKNFLENNKKSTLFSIEAVNGKRISGYTRYANEEEVILRMGTTFRVKSDPFNQSDGLYIVHLVEIDDNNDEPLPAFINEINLGAKSLDKGASGSTFKSNVHPNTIWIQNGFTVAGGNGRGNKLNQLSSPTGVYIDDEQTVYVVDVDNHRILGVKYDGNDVQIVAGGNGQGNKTNQLKIPSDVIVDKERNNLIICDEGNRRIMRWSRQNNTNGQTIMSNIDCCRLTMDNNGNLYVSDWRHAEVRRWKMNDTCGTLVAGGNGIGNRLDQLDCPIYIFVDEDHSVYVSDRQNHRVVKWMEGAKEGIVVAGGQGKGNDMTQLSCPYGVFVDHYGTVYVTDCNNHRIMRWVKGATCGNIVVGGNGRGQRPNQLSYPFGLSFDQEGNLYVVDFSNNRVQRYTINHE